ncbi:trans-sulfuration enzyme family protein [Marinigracilibium pacificum]|uniref:O-succinylhomoserine sulfhydrylase n=1 Tax=Marinigracilibium pacificum TaxID=2729599 RepID=A0A848J835_9BACT|nr:aminotransferase class I/II-fold pyridoxal phosphate-dependent enzyme [Marinigracilibium pacificum]NMM50650.1 aminotransferase class I/II-fold pyridoxal phosphate-dependent enzyme [Marinigracilibium pacificum]
MADFKHFETNAVRTRYPQTEFNEHSSPLFLTSSFTFDDAEHARALFQDEIEGNIYSRFSNPNVSEFVDKLCALEGTEAGFATATGMSAMFTSMASLLRTGDHIIASRAVFGSTHQLFTKIFPRWGVQTTYVDINASADEWQKAVQPNTKMIFAETPSNPGLDIIDLEWLGSFAKENNLILNIDNCFATPYLQNPAKYGAHIVTHSATKFIDGQGRVLGGAVLGTKELIDEVRFFSRQTGPVISPFNAWILSKSLETLPVRMDRHCSNALELANYFTGHSDLNWVKYPFLPSHPQYEIAKKQMKHGGGLITFEVKGGVERGAKFLNNLKMCSLSANLGDTRSIVTHPASTTHSKLSEEERAAVSITPGLVRVSVGLENINDIVEDLEQALRASR